MLAALITLNPVSTVEVSVQVSLMVSERVGVTTRAVGAVGAGPVAARVVVLARLEAAEPALFTDDSL